MLWANEFCEIPTALSENAPLRNRVTHLVCERDIPGKVTEGGMRLQLLRRVLSDLIEGRISLVGAVDRVELELCPETSTYAGNNRVFCKGWAERLVRTQLSRFYNQAVLEILKESGESEAFIPHSSAEAPESNCSQVLAGKTHAIQLLLSRLQTSYEQGTWNRDIKVPDHPHCTHVVRPLPQAEAKLMAAARDGGTDAG